MATRKKARGKRTRKAASSRKRRVKRRSSAPLRKKVKIQRKRARPRPQKAPQPKPAAISLPKMTLGEKEIGFISHYFSGIGVGIVEVTNGTLNVGDKVRIKGETTDFTQKVDSMQYEHQPINKAEAGKSVGIKVTDRVREHDKVFLVQ